MPFSDNLTRMLKDRGITVYRLAHDIGVPKSTVYTWTSGQKNPSAEHVLKVAKYLGVQMEVLLQ